MKQTEGNALYRISPELTCELIASSRRRPPVHPLDLALTGKPFSVSQSRNGGVMIGANPRSWVWTLIDSASAAAPELLNERFVENMEVTSCPGLIVRRQYPDRDRSRFLRIELLDVEGAELLLAHPELDRLGRARFSYPKELENLAASECLAAWRDGGLDVLIWDRSLPRNGSTVWLARIDAEASTVHPLRFAWPADGDQRIRAAGRDSKVFRYPHPKSLVATDRGLMIAGWGMEGFWFIPKEELEKRRSISRAATESR